MGAEARVAVTEVVARAAARVAAARVAAERVAEEMVAAERGEGRAEAGMEVVANRRLQLQLQTARRGDDPAGRQPTARAMAARAVPMMEAAARAAVRAVAARAAAATEAATAAARAAVRAAATAATTVKVWR
jgi:hypothetical protein